MISITFDCSSVTSVISASVVYGTDFFNKRLNQFTIPTADGDKVTYDKGPTVVHGVLVLKGVSYTDGNGLRGWLQNTLIFEKNSFTISAIPNVDLGNGKNTQLTGVRYDGGNSDEGVFKYVAPGCFDINFPFRYVR